MKEPVGVIKFVRFHYIYMMNLCSCQKTVLDLHFEIFTYSFLGDLFRVLFLYEMTCFASEEISLLNALTKKFGHTICPRCTQYWFLAPSLFLLHHNPPNSASTLYRLDIHVSSYQQVQLH